MKHCSNGTAKLLIRSNTVGNRSHKQCSERDIWLNSSSIFCCTFFRFLSVSGYSAKLPGRVWSALVNIFVCQPPIIEHRTNKHGALSYERHHPSLDKLHSDDDDTGCWYVTLGWQWMCVQLPSPVLIVANVAVRMASVLRRILSMVILYRDIQCLLHAC